MASPKPKAATVGRRQGDRPGSPSAPSVAQGPRALQGALTLPIEQVVPDPDQPRKDTDAGGLEELAASLTEYGILQPLLVREVGLLDDGRTRYMVVAGGRRYAAAQRAGLTLLPVVVRESEGAALRVTQLIENVQRQDLAPLEEARAFKELMDAEGLNIAQLADRLHISEQKVSDRLLVLSRPPVADAVQRGQITPTAARDILRMAEEPQAELLGRVTAGERVSSEDIKQAREQAKATGVVNPRSKGGGRVARAQPRLTTKAATPLALEHTAYVPNASDAPTGSLESALVRLDSAAVHDLLTYGTARQWTCQQLLDAVQELRSNATG